MKPSTLLAACFVVAATSTVVVAQDVDPVLATIVDGGARSANNKARDGYRHPKESLAFFGVKPDSIVVEILPGGGYWSEILNPYVQAKGRYRAAVFNFDPATADAQKFAADFYARFPGSEVVGFAADAPVTGPEGSADFVLTFRDIHNWMKRGTAESAFRNFYKTLKPGGVLGVEEHRAKADVPQDPQALSGYVREDEVVKLAEGAGFKLVARSEINANPKDTKDYPEGVWTLPPTYRLKEVDHAKYEAIGESDRATLKFVKPGG